MISILHADARHQRRWYPFFALVSVFSVFAHLPARPVWKDRLADRLSGQFAQWHATLAPSLNFLESCVVALRPPAQQGKCGKAQV